MGGCFNGDDCDFFYDFIFECILVCLYYVWDSCIKFDCKYVYVKVFIVVFVCCFFGFYGYCEGGVECFEWYVFECFDFSNIGMCKIWGCKFFYWERVSVFCKVLSFKSEDVEMEDVLSDDDGEFIDDYDVDLDEVDEFIGEDEIGGFDFIE